MLRDNEVEEPATAEQIERPKTCPMQRTSASVDRISSKDGEVAGKPLNLKDDGRRKPSDDMLGVEVVSQVQASLTDGLSARGCLISLISVKAESNVTLSVAVATSVSNACRRAARAG